MSRPTAAPYGSWESLLDAEHISRGAVPLGQLETDGEEILWLEGRPLEGGRSVLVRCRADARSAADSGADARSAADSGADARSAADSGADARSAADSGADARSAATVRRARRTGTPVLHGIRTADSGIDGAHEVVTPPGFNVRTRVHEYGGGAYVARGGTAWFSNFSDQRVYRQERGGLPVPVTPEPARGAGARYADFRLAADGGTILCVRELHPDDGREAVNEIVAFPADGSAPPRTVVGGHDFFASPRISPDGRAIAWLSWDHPRMPWDGTMLWTAGLEPDGTVVGAQAAAGGDGESIFQPEWSPAGDLCFVSDRTGWWNLYRLRQGTAEALAPMEAECGVPQWAFGLSTYAFLDERTIACAFISGGRQRLGLLRVGAGRMEPLDTSLCDFRYPRRAAGGRLAFIGAGPREGAAVRMLDAASGAVTTIRPALDFALPADAISEARHLPFPGAGGRTAFAHFYPPVNPRFAGPAGEKPPLIVMSHGGPTGMAGAGFDPAIQFWTSRGFAVVDVNYGGSSGFGREYRGRLKGAWGIVDVEDCLGAARFLAGRGEVDPRRMAIRGGSAGGYTTLCALTFHDLFAAGASYYGVADLEALATDTHKFESRYLDGLVAPYPAGREVYVARSPLHFTDRLSCPVILFQGLEDRVVPPQQAEAMAAALRRKRLPMAYLTFPGEQHGFRGAATIRRTLEAELYFYSRIFAFRPAGEIEPVDIENL
jgi:dipeptidyl aminopeptidase/acylaminoacyl peptidase